MSSLQTLDILRRSATTSPSPSVRTELEIAKLIDISKCIGCKACQSACMEWNDVRDEVGSNVGVYDNPPDLSDKSWTVMRFTEHETEAGKLEWLIRKDGCMHCADPGCLKACPAPGAIVQYANGIVDFIEEACIGCGSCITGCPFDVPRISKADDKAYKCTLCSDRVSVGLEPACVKACPTGAITFGTKVAMQDHAADRVVDLKERGYLNAGLYDPPGVGGTHVMYVLQHADTPQIYSGLPADPHISPLVSIWKGVMKPLALAAMGAAALVGFFHYVTVGPNDADSAPGAADAPRSPVAGDPAMRVERYRPLERVNHWIVAISFVLAALSGLALFHPALYWLGNFLGGGPWTRILHPFIAVVTVVAFFIMAANFWRDNLMQAVDWQWLRQWRDVLGNHEERLPRLGRYNAGQKCLFWVMVACMLMLPVSGVVFWRPWFAIYFPIGLVRLATLAHALAAAVLILGIIVHVYAAIWIKGSIGAMVRGTVSVRWAAKHHANWLQEKMKRD